MRALDLTGQRFGRLVAFYAFADQMVAEAKPAGGVTVIADAMSLFATLAAQFTPQHRQAEESAPEQRNC